MAMKFQFDSSGPSPPCLAAANCKVSCMFVLAQWAQGSSVQLPMEAPSSKPRFGVWVSSAPLSRRKVILTGEVTSRRHDAGLRVSVPHQGLFRTRLGLRSSVAEPKVRDALALQCGVSLEELDHDGLAGACHIRDNGITLMFETQWRASAGAGGWGPAARPPGLGPVARGGPGPRST